MASPTTLNPAPVALWASAFVIGALIIVQAGRLPGNPAHADMSTTRGDYVLLTANAGTGGDEAPDEVLYVIDNRTQVILAYEVEDATKKRVELRDGGLLDNLFRQAR